jgi:hypothetical protein
LTSELRLGASVQENPVLLGVLSLVAGAVVGSLLPLTSPEASLLREPARQAARAGMDAAAHPEHERTVGSE